MFLLKHVNVRSEVDKEIIVVKGFRLYVGQDNMLEMGARRKKNVGNPLNLILP